MQKYIHRDRKPLIDIFRKSVGVDAGIGRTVAGACENRGTERVDFLGKLLTRPRLRAFTQHLRCDSRQSRPDLWLIQASRSVDIKLHVCKREAVVFQNQNGKAVVELDLRRFGNFHLQYFLGNRRTILSFHLTELWWRSL